MRFKRWFSAMFALLRRRWKSALALFLLLMLLGINGVAFLHARAMTHYSGTAPRTQNPRELSSGEKVSALVAGVSNPRPTNRHDPGSRGLVFETVHFAANDGVELEGWWLPNGELESDVAVLFHGYASSKSSLLPEAQYLLERGLSVLLVDFRGSGGSSGDHTTLGWNEALDVAAALDHARQRPGTKRVLLYGMSMGAAAVLRATAIGVAEADALILEGPFNSLLATTQNRFHQMGLPAFPFAQLLLFWGGWQCGFDAFDHNPETYLDDVSIPLLLLFGAEDPHVTVDDAQRLIDAAGRVRSPDVWWRRSSAAALAGARRVGSTRV